MKRLDVFWSAAFGVPAMALVVSWSTKFVDDRPMCSGASKLTYPHRDTCFGDQLSRDWVLTHPSVLGLVVLAAIAALTLGWLYLRSRRPESA